MTTILDRLREVLAPEYHVEEELAKGGMGIVFRAREVLLDRPVAIKIIRPELASARAADKFLREARILANLRHPNVVPVHRAGEVEGFFYYVMEFIEGETLADRLEKGPLPRAEALKLGRDLLAALEAVHSVGVVHRDIKPSNILLIGDRAVLTDFGIAKPSVDPSTAPPRPGRVVGTVGYMPPEQAFGWNVTPRTDLFAAAAVVYEAYTGRRWGDQMPDRRPNWGGIPRTITPVLRRALTWRPEERWPDAASFRRKLWRTRTRRYRQRAFLLTVGALVAGAVAVLVLLPSNELPLTDVTVLPFEAGNGIGSDLTERLTSLTEQNLGGFVTVTASYRAHELWNKSGQSMDSIGKRDLEEIGTRAAVHAVVTRDSADTAITIEVIDQSNAVQRASAVHMRGERTLEATGHVLGRSVAAVLAPNRQSEFRGLPLSDLDEATTAYLDGLEAFKRNAFYAATDHFHTAMSLDTTFGQAQWWHQNAWRWLMTGEPAPDADLERLFEQQGEDLSELTQMLIKAQLATSQDLRMAAYEEATARYPNHAYAAFLYADESQTRGAFVGIPLEKSTQRLEAAAAMDSTFAPTHLALIWSYIRLARRAEAERSLQRYAQVYSSADAPANVHPDLFGWLILERFDQEAAAAQQAKLSSDPDKGALILQAFRLAAMWDLARLQAVIAGNSLSAAEFNDSARAELHEGRGLALIGLGRIKEALWHIDSAAVLFDTDEARLEAAEWRVVAPALGLSGVSHEEVERGRTMIDQVRSDALSHSRSRAAWALGVDAAASGDTIATKRWLDSLRVALPDTIAERLAMSLTSMDLGIRGMYDSALDASAALLPHDSAGRAGDPFERAVLHLKRAEWYDNLGRKGDADAARLWYEHFEAAGGYPNREARASEIDWALSPYVRLLRARAAEQRGNRERACNYMSRLVELWAGADSAYTPLRDEALAYTKRRCG
jgi:serine/threonine protein kinase